MASTPAPLPSLGLLDGLGGDLVNQGGDPAFLPHIGLLLGRTAANEGGDPAYLPHIGLLLGPAPVPPPVITQSFGNFGWDPRKRLSWKRHELREELEAALDDAPKAVQELVRVPGPDISEVPVREALEIVRKARKSKDRLVLRQEIDELHEAVETVAAFVKEREAARQARRRKQQHLLLLS